MVGRGRGHVISRRPATMQNDYRWISDTAGLAELASNLGEAPRHALDTESNSSFVYRERLCLLQFNIEGSLWVVDPLAVAGGERSLDPIRAPLESSEVTTLVHGGEFDVACLKRDYGISLGGVWDSQQTASLLGREKTGYGTLVEEVCGVVLPKAYARYDWGRRPLESGPLHYALNDVLYLPEVCEVLGLEARAADLEEEIDIAHRAVEDATWNGGYRPESLWKIKGVGGLDPAKLPILVALFAWRDEVGRRIDLPPGRVMNNQALLAAARNPPRHVDGLRRLGLRGEVKSRFGGEILRAVREARRSPPELPVRPPRGDRDPVARGRSERLKAWRRTESEKRGVTPQVVLPATALQYLVRAGADRLDEVPQLGPKRIRLYGETFERLCS